jgi:hypothetical protein
LEEIYSLVLEKNIKACNSHLKITKREGLSQSGVEVDKEELAIYHGHT